MLPVSVLSSITSGSVLGLLLGQDGHEEPSDGAVVLKAPQGGFN